MQLRELTLCLTIKEVTNFVHVDFKIRHLKNNTIDDFIPIHVYSFHPTLIPSYSQTLILSYSQTLILLYSQTLILSYSQTLVPSYSQTLIPSYSQTLILLYLDVYLQIGIHGIDVFKNVPHNAWNDATQL